MEQKILEKLREAEMILVGIGEEFSPAVPESCREKELYPYLQSKYYDTLPEDHEVIRAYSELRSLIGAKPYFVVTMNTDDLIYRTGFEQDLIVAPCGSMQKLQCTEHIVEAGEIRDRILEMSEVKDTADHTDFVPKETGLQTSEKCRECSSSEVIRRNAVCPVCGAPLQFHTTETEGYLEQGYLPQWSRYTKWLSCTLNRRLCILELGVGFRYPRVVRFPFEKAAVYNQKATLVRVHSRLAQLPEELSQRGISVKKSPVQFLLEN